MCNQERKTENSSLQTKKKNILHYVIQNYKKRNRILFAGWVFPIKSQLIRITIISSLQTADTLFREIAFPYTIHVNNVGDIVIRVIKEEKNSRSDKK